MRDMRETANAAMDQMIPHLAGDIVSGRAEANWASIGGTCGLNTYCVTRII